MSSDGAQIYLLIKYLTGKEPPGKAEIDSFLKRNEKVDALRT